VPTWISWEFDVTTEQTGTVQAEVYPGGWFRRDATLYVVIGLCHLPLVVLQLHRMWQIECYRYFPFLLAAVGWLLWRQWHQLPVRPTCQPTRSSLATLLAGLGLLSAAVLMGSPWLGTVAAIVSVLAVLLSFGRYAAARLTPAWSLLWLMLPLPFRWDQRLFLWLQGGTCEGGSRVLDAWGYNHVLAGYVLDVPGRQFLVEELGGGVQSLFALIAAAAVLAVWQNRGFIHGVLLVGCGVFWAVALNMVGAALTVVLLVARGVDVTDGGAGYLFDAGLFLAALLILLSTDRLLLFLGESPGVKPVEDDEGNLIGMPAGVAGKSETPPGPEPLSPLPPPAGRWGLRVLAAAFLVVGMLQAASWGVVAQRTNKAMAAAANAGERDRVPLTDVLTAGSLPRSLGDWKAVGFQAETRTPESDLGHYSLVWRYADGRDDAAVSLDFPFAVRRDPGQGFELRGWEIEARTVLEAEAASGPVLELRMRDASGRRGYLLASLRTESGLSLTPPALAGWSLSAWCKKAGDRVLERFGQVESEPATFQIQLLVTGDLPLDEARQRQARAAFRLAAEKIRERVWPQEASS
jgi:exosortase